MDGTLRRQNQKMLADAQPEYSNSAIAAIA
jgi:hypothetical protein